MRVNGISSINFRSVLKAAAKNHILNNEKFVKNTNGERKKFENFLKKQSENCTYHVGYDNKSGKYTVEKLIMVNEYQVENNANTATYRTYVPAKIENSITLGQDRRYVQEKGVQDFKDEFEDIYEAGEACNQYEDKL